MADEGGYPEFGFTLADIAAGALRGRRPDVPLLELLSSVAPAEAAILTRCSRTSHLLYAGAVFGYGPGAVAPMTSPEFLSRDPAYRSILRGGSRSPIRSWVDPDYAYEQSPAARGFLLPAGFRGGLSMRLSTATGHHVGDFHMSTKDRFVPSPAQLAVLGRSLAVVADILDDTATSPQQPVVLVDEGRTVVVDGAQQSEFAPLLPCLRSHATAGRSERSRSFRWLGPSRTWYRVDLHWSGPGLRAEAHRETLPHRLSHRELEVLDRLCTGATNGEIAQQLCLSERTVAHHVERILDKLAARTRTAAVAIAVREGLTLCPAVAPRRPRP